MGDLRLLFSVHDGSPVGVLYDYRCPGANDPVEFRSVTTTRVDRLVVLADSRVAIDRSSDGYTLRASVPLSELDFHAEPGQAYAGDFGIVYSDSSGTGNSLRMHWANQATGIVSDLSSEAAIQPQSDAVGHRPVPPFARRTGPAAKPYCCCWTCISTSSRSA